MALLAAVASAQPELRLAAHADGDIERQAESPAVADGEASPFILGAAVRQELTAQPWARAPERQRLDALLAYLLQDRDLEYRRVPTRTAQETWESGSGNCLSFVNLLVAMARAVGLEASFVEIRDHERWDQEQGLVVSQGHIVAAVGVEGRRRIVDFLPYEPRSYTRMLALDDRQAVAHYHNNLAGEALIDGRIDEAARHAGLALEHMPDFAKAINNRAVVALQHSDLDTAQRVLEEGLRTHEDDVALLSNLALVHQRRGESKASEALLDRIEAVRHTNPFFFVFRGEQAYERGDWKAAEEAFRRALRLDSELPDVHVGLTRLYLSTGEARRARRHFNRAADLDPSLPELAQLSAQVEALE